MALLEERSGQHRLTSKPAASTAAAVTGSCICFLSIRSVRHTPAEVLAQEQCSSTGGFAGQHGRSDHRMGLLTVVEAATLIQCSLRLNRHLQHRGRFERQFPARQQACRLVALEWPRWGPPRALRARRSGNTQGRAPTQVHPSGCLTDSFLRSTVSCRRRCSRCSHHPLPLLGSGLMLGLSLVPYSN